MGKWGGKRRGWRIGGEGEGEVGGEEKQGRMRNRWSR